jgi:medium-chain acyl-[acyl-carrier-protein] hydrolase
MEQVAFYKDFIVSSYELNPLRKARLTTMANYFQEVAYQHANELGFGYRQMKERQTMWLLSRLKIVMERYPSWDEKIRVETWPSGVDRLFAVRDYRVLDAGGAVLGMASSYWLIVNIATHRPIRPRQELAHYAKIIYLDPVFDTGLEKIHLPESLPHLHGHSVRYSDLDIIGHVNNVKYMEWCIDTAYTAGRVSREIAEFEINFTHEAMPGDQVEIRGLTHSGQAVSRMDAGQEARSQGGPGPAEDLLLLSRKPDGQEYVRARIRWMG